MTQQTIKEAAVEYLTEVPAKDNTEDLPAIPESIAQNFAIWGELTNTQALVLTALGKNIFAENRKTDAEIAEDCGVSRRTIYYCRANPTFSRALGLICLEVVRGNEDIILGKMLARLDKDWKVGEFALRYSGSYVPASKQMSLHADVTKQAQTASREQNIDDMLIDWGSKGLSIQWIAERWAKLKSEGAF